MNPVLSVAARFWQGLMLSTGLLIAMILFLTVTMGQGREWAPLYAFLISFVAVPLVMLANCWMLFVPWRSRFLMLLASLIVPSPVAIGVLLYVHGYGSIQSLGTTLLTPCFYVTKAITPYPLPAFSVWLVLMVAVVYLAHRRARLTRETEAS